MNPDSVRLVQDPHLRMQALVIQNHANYPQQIRRYRHADDRMEKRRVPYRRVGAPDPQHRADGVLDEAYGVVESVSVSGASLHRHYVREYVDEAHDQREHDAAHHVRAER